MASQFYGLNIAYTGLLASNASLNTTANNIANVETEGYSRQEINKSAAEALRTYTTFGCSGAGVDVKDIQRVRDEFYDTKYWNNQCLYGEYDKKAYYMDLLQQYFTDDDSVKGFTAVFDDMYKALNELQKSAGDSTVKQQFVGYAGNLTTYFNEMAENLTRMQEDVNSEIKVKCDEVNSISQEIAALNKQINIIELTGVTANELRDQRTLLVDQLSKIVDVKAEETPITDVNDPTRLTGANRYRVTIAGGQTLVDMNDYRVLECVARETTNKAYQSDAEGLYDILISSSDGRLKEDFGMYNAAMSGELAGLIQMRDGNNGENFNGTVVDLSKDFQGNAKVKIQVEDIFLTDLNKLTIPNSGTINIGNTLYHYDGWSFDTEKKQYTFNLNKADNTEELDRTKLGRESNINSPVNYQGIPYYQAQMNEWVRQYAKAFNGILTQDGSADGYGEKGSMLFTANLPKGDARFNREDNLLKTITSEDDCYRLLTAKNFKVTDILKENPDRLATRTDKAAGQDKFDIVDQLIDMKSNPKVMSFRGGSASDFLESMLADVALNAERSFTFRDNAQTLSNRIDMQRESISGVDQDEEAVNLVKFQNAYNLSSKVIQVLTEIYDRLILQTGV